LTRNRGDAIAAAMALYPLIRPLIFTLDAERAHHLTLAALKLRPPLKTRHPGVSPLAIRVAGLDFPNPIGLAPGFDKDAQVFRQALGLGFGFVEVGNAYSPPAGRQSPSPPVPAGRGSGSDQSHGIQ
jgi:dihydroorotate dehydrogenase